MECAAPKVKGIDRFSGFLDFPHPFREEQDSKCDKESIPYASGRQELEYGNKFAFFQTKAHRNHRFGDGKNVNIGGMNR